MNTNDPCYKKWLALGAPRHRFPGLVELVDEAIFLSIACSAATRPIMFDFAIDEPTVEAAYYSEWASDFERNWLYAFLSLSLEHRASVLAAHEQFWNTLSGTDHETRTAA